MNWLRLVLVAAGLVAFTQAEELDYDTVVPFSETKASAAEYSLALKFKPQLNIVTGCHPYPAVDAEGNTNAGTGVISFKSCKGSSLGSQIYGRATTYEDSYAIMYSWYFPRDRKSVFGHRHSWEHIIVWVEKTGSTEASISSVPAAISRREYFTVTPPDADMVDDASVKIQYDAKTFGHFVNITTMPGDFQDLVLWEDMSSAARAALNQNDFGTDSVPFNEENFLENLGDARSME